MAEPYGNPGPSVGRVVRTLRDGFWDRTDVIELPGGQRRVRKASKGDPGAGPWGAETLRREIAYLRDIDPAAGECFPQLLAAWDDGERLGYEMAYLDGTTDVGALAAAGEVDQPWADALQDRLAGMVFGRVHVPAEDGEPLSAHVRRSLADVLAGLADDAIAGPLLASERIELNGEPVLAPAAAVAELDRRGGILAELDRPPRVRLHGDLFLENVVVPGVPGGGWRAEPVLLDPVSVAGVWRGHPLFDLVKYESYATGELLALRTERLDASGFDAPGERRYTWGVRWEDPAIAPFRRIDWSGRFCAAYEAAFGPPLPAARELLEAYFALVMAACTHGTQRKGRLLRGTEALNAALAGA